MAEEVLGLQGAKSVEVRPVGISKGLAMSRIINAIAARGAQEAVRYDFVLVAGHFLVRDENIFTFFEGQSLKVSLAAVFCAHCWSACHMPGWRVSGGERQHLDWASGGEDCAMS